jgi:PTS system nitrogen regulatory IIA component
MNADLIAQAVIVAALAATDKVGALTESLAAAVHGRLVAKKDTTAMLARLREREQLGSTGIGGGVAIPHVKCDDLLRMGLVVARSFAGIEYDAIDGRPVQILFLLLAPASQREQHLAALRWISGLARNGDFRRFFLAAKSADEVRALLREMCGLS